MNESVVPTSKLSRLAGMVDAGRRTRALRTGADAQVRAAAAEHLVARLGRLRGLPQKMGQILSMGDDPEAQESLEALRDSADPIPLAELAPAMEAVWGEPVDAVCSQLDPDGHAASLGQVHRATLAGGPEVAVKVQYPGIREAIQADLKLLGWIGKPFGGFAKGFEMADYQSTIADALEEELDYRAEATAQREYARLARGLKVVVPEVVAERSGERVLVSAWEDGETIEEACRWSAEQRRLAAEALVEHFTVMLLRHGVVHADPHPGNYRFRRAGQRVELVLYDFGSVHRLAEDERLALLRLIRESHSALDADPFPLFLKLGFREESLAPLRHKLPALCRVLFAPFASQGKFDTSTWSRSERVSAILGDDRWNFRVSGPAQLIFLMRAFHGLVFYLDRLAQPVLWRRFLDPIVAECGSAMSGLALPATAGAPTTYAALAEHLCVRVTDGTTVKAKLSLPVNAVDRLEGLLAEDVLAQVRARGIDLDEIVHRARAKQYAPQDLFRLEEGTRVFEVWLQ